MTFDDLFHTFASCGLLVAPSEIHGMLCGRLVMGEVLEEPDLLRLTAEYLDREELDDLEAELVALYRECHEQMYHQGFEFRLMLPDEEFAIGERTQALASWCQGFLYGLGRAGLQQGTTLSDEAVESLEDLSAISQLHFEDADNDDEMNFFELTEFVRVVVLVLHAELNQHTVEEKPTLH